MLSGILGIFVVLFKHYSKDKKICKERKNDAQIFFMAYSNNIFYSDLRKTYFINI